MEAVIPSTSGADHKRPINSDVDLSSIKSKKRKKDKKKKTKKSRPSTPVIEFTGKEEYYVDKNGAKGYISIETLHKPARPRYYSSKKIIGNHKYRRIFEKPTRYFSSKFNKSSNHSDDDNHIDKITDETEFVLKVKEFNEHLHQNSTDVDKWLEFTDHQDRTCLKLSKTQIAEKKIEILDRALKENPKNSILFEKYIDIITRVLPFDSISIIVEKLLTKDPTSYILWEALINATQGSMARCVVPDVLKLYERCMQTLYNKLGDDEITLSEYHYLLSLFNL